jgi:dihydrofolate synthase/folylpolyglutamate synthase
MSTLSYRASIDFLFKLETSAVKLGLENTLSLLGAMGNPETSFQSVHVAGTNGKGSVASFLNSILFHNGLATGLFTSPHLVDYRERVRKNGAAMSEARVAEIVSEIRDLVRRTGASYFEATTALAFDYFRKEQVDVAVVEVGMGGRLDSTNVISPLATCITTIGFDHQQYLGRTLARIAGEKAGIIKAGTPVVCGTMPAAARRTITEIARRKGAPVFEAGDHATVTLMEMSRTGSVFEYQGLGPKRTLAISLLGSHQVANAALAVLTAEVLASAGLKVSDRAIEVGLARARWPGRLQVVRRRPTVIVDGAHNVSGARVLARSLGEIGITKPVTVFGVLRDKSCEKMLAALARCAGRFVFTSPAYHRALPLSQLRRAGKALGLEAKGFPTVAGALEHTFQHVDRGEAILVCGSLYVIGEAMQFMGYRPQSVRLC